MCGRFGLTRPERLDFARLGVGALPPLAPRYNIAPGSDVLVVRQRKGERRADLVRWGLVPHWATDPSIGNRLVNARAESAREKPAFRAAMLARRCLIPADVFYEWQAVPGQRRKRPFAVRLRGDDPFALGGLWEYWRANPETAGLASCTILTTEPNELLRPIHERMPVLVAPEQYDAWLDPRTPESAVDELFRPYPAQEMAAWPITFRVNDPAADDETVLAPDAAAGGGPV